MKRPSLSNLSLTLDTSIFAKRIMLTMLVASFGIALARPCCANPFTFTLTTSMPKGRDGHTATLLNSGKVLVAAGNVGDATAVLYDPTTATWGFTGNLSTGRWLHTATLLSDGKVLVAGGADSSRFGFASHIEVYDPATGIWTVSARLVTNRVAHTATLLQNGKVLIAAGSTKRSRALPTSAAELYDPSSGTSTATGSLSTARYSSSATLLANGKVLVAGGATGESGFGQVASAELYDPATGAWTFTGSMSFARSLHTATLLRNGQVLVAGGLSNQVPLQSAELYNPSTGTWTVTGALNNPRFSAEALRLPNGNVLLAAGGFPFHVATELYNPATALWTLAGDLATTNAGAPGTLLQNGEVLLEGGLDANGALTAAAQVGSHWLPSLSKTLNQALERTADRREDLLSMTSTMKPEAQRALVSGRSACSR
jgi:Galactose oxidase, central domain